MKLGIKVRRIKFETKQYKNKHIYMYLYADLDQLCKLETSWGYECLGNLENKYDTQLKYVDMEDFIIWPDFPNIVAFDYVYDFSIRIIQELENRDNIEINLAGYSRGIVFSKLF